MGISGAAFHHLGQLVNGELGTAIWRGMRETRLVPASTIFAVFFGFGTLASQSGISPFEVLFAAAFLFAGPAQIVLADQIGTGAAPIAAILAAGATGVRLFPMTLALMPRVRTPGTPRWLVYANAHFMTITTWFEAVNRFPGVPRPMRAGYMLGFSLHLAMAGMLGAIIGFVVVGELPRSVAAAFLFLPPIYFMLSMLGGVRKVPELIPIAAGFLLTPFFHTYAPRMDLLLTGVTGGSLAFWGAWMLSQRAEHATETTPEQSAELTAEQPIEKTSAQDGDETSPAPQHPAQRQEMLRFPMSMWVMSQVFWLALFLRLLAHFGADTGGAMKSGLPYVLAAVSAGLALWVVFRSPNTPAKAAASSALADDSAPAADAESIDAPASRTEATEAAPPVTAAAGGGAQLPLNVWLVSQLPWLVLVLALPLIATVLGGDATGSRHIYILLGAFLAHEVWRLAGVLLSNNLSEDGVVIQWALVVSTSLIAGLVARIVLYPPGALAEVDIIARVGAFVAGGAVFYLLRRNFVYGVLSAMGLVAIYQQIHTFFH